MPYPDTHAREGKAAGGGIKAVSLVLETPLARAWKVRPRCLPLPLLSSPSVAHSRCQDCPLLSRIHLTGTKWATTGRFHFVVQGSLNVKNIWHLLRRRHRGLRPFTAARFGPFLVAPTVRDPSPAAAESRATPAGPAFHARIIMGDAFLIKDYSQSPIPDHQPDH